VNLTVEKTIENNIIYNDVREGIPSGRMNRDVMPHGIVDCIAGKKQLGFVEALQFKLGCV
jgi:hypothetical protein